MTTKKATKSCNDCTYFYLSKGILVVKKCPKHNNKRVLK